MEINSMNHKFGINDQFKANFIWLIRTNFEIFLLNDGIKVDLHFVLIIKE